MSAGLAVVEAGRPPFLLGKVVDVRDKHFEYCFHVNDFPEYHGRSWLDPQVPLDF